MRKLIGLLLLVVALGVSTEAKALSSQWQRDGAVDVRLISNFEGVGLRKDIPLGLEVRMEPGWHTYWRSPGVAGLPPDIDWSASLNEVGNLQKATISYPPPKRYIDQGLETIGYQGRVIFPIKAELREVGRPLVINANLTLLACSVQCVPKKFNLELTVPHDAAVEGPEADQLNPFIRLIPNQDVAAAGLSITNMVNNGINLIVGVQATHVLEDPDIFIEAKPEIPFSAPTILLADDKRSATLTLHSLDTKAELSKLGDTPITVTLVDEGHAVELPMTIPHDINEATHPYVSFQYALLLALIGGFILNLMPCVLPVLSLKVMSLVGKGGRNKREIRQSFLMTAAGVMFSFLLLAVMTILFKTFGLSLGWGVQFQHPLFLITLIILLTGFAANMWGLFEISLPAFLQKHLSEHHPQLMGDFASGALATLLATPCTAPFLGTAVGFALASNSIREIFGIFIMLGIGMVVPYVIVAFIPEIAGRFPKPGKWMLHLRVVLGFALSATAIWLLWVLSSQITHLYALAVAFCMIGITALLGVHTYGIRRFAVLLGMAFLASIAIALSISGKPEPTPEQKIQSQWQPFNEAAIAVQVATGRVVFVDVTADWCITCKVNKKLVLSDDDIKRNLFNPNVIAMQGDWTNPNADITNFLHKFRRYGIPFDIVYGPGAPNGITLPEVLTHDDVMDAITKARQK